MSEGMKGGRQGGEGRRGIMRTDGGFQRQLSWSQGGDEEEKVGQRGKVDKEIIRRTLQQLSRKG